MDMKEIIKDWEVEDSPNDVAILRADSSRPINLSLNYTDAQPRPTGKTLIMQARTLDGEELWAIRMLPSGRLLIGLGTMGHRETACAFFPVAELGISYRPDTGGLSVVVKDDPYGPATETLIGSARNGWAAAVVRPEDYEIMIGAPITYADGSPIGWKISASFRYGLSTLPLAGGGHLEEVGPAEAAEPDDQDPRILAIGRAIASLENRYDALKRRLDEADARPGAGQSQEDGDTLGLKDVLHWEAMLNIASGEAVISQVIGNFFAEQAAYLVNAHLAWCKENKR